MMSKSDYKNAEIINTLIKMADGFDASGDFEKAARVDDTIKSIARGRPPKAPLKSLDDNVKKSLVKFLHNVGKRMKESNDDLQELSRRMRYFDKINVLKPFGLDQAMKDISHTQKCVDAAKEKLYVLTFGGGKSSLNKFLEKLDSDDANDGTRKPKNDEKLCRYCKGEGYSGPFGDTCGHCDGSGLEIEMPESYDDQDDYARDTVANDDTSEEPTEEELSEEEEALMELWNSYDEATSSEESK